MLPSNNIANGVVTSSITKAQVAAQTEYDEDKTINLKAEVVDIAGNKAVINIASTKLFILGTGTPNPNPERMGSSYLVLANDEPYLFDYGTGVVRRIASFSPSWGGEYQALEVENLKYAFLTHIHSDHTLGLADLIITPWIMGRSEPLKIFGPKGAKYMHTNIIKAYQPDIDYRIYGTQPQNSTGYKVIFNELKDKFVYQDENIKVTAFSNDHGDLQESYGFLIETTDKKILISGDTTMSKNLISFINPLKD